MDRQIVHLNIAHFMASLEVLREPSLRGLPFVIAAPGDGRGVVLDLSETAYREGLFRGMPLERAERVVRKLRVVPPDRPYYSRAERYLYEQASRFSPFVDQLPGGHLYIDITGTRSLFGNPVDLAARITREVSSRLAISPVTGLAANRLVSKVATRVVKPAGFVSVRPGDEQSFLRYQHIGLLPGIGRKLLERLSLLGIGEIGALAGLSDTAVTLAMGRQGVRLRDSARGLDFSLPAFAAVPSRQVRKERILDSDTDDPAAMESLLFLLAEEAGMDIRQNKLSARRVELSLWYTDGEKTGAHVILPRPSSLDRDFFDAGRGLLGRTRERRVRMRKLALSLSCFQAETDQLDLFAPPEGQRRELLQRAIDRIRARYGMEALRVGPALRTLRP